MASWLKKIRPLQIKQSNDIPYVILESGVFLCFDNFYSENKESLTYHISFFVDKKTLKRKTTNYYEFKNFPQLIKFHNIIELNDCISADKMNLKTQDISTDEKYICIIKDEYIQKLGQNKLSILIDNIKNYDKTFVLLRKDQINDKIRDFLNEDICSIIHVDWYRTAVIISDNICESSNRNYCWTSFVPAIYIDCYGINDKNEFDYIKKAFYDINVRHDITWK